jgi:outer membrane protein OmpA-like peptidoglycan-associated protein
MRLSTYKWKVQLLCATLIVLLAGVLSSASPRTRQITAGERTTVKGMILARHGNLVMVREKNSGDPVVVNLLEDTKIERKKRKIEFFRHTSMDATAMVPGLTIEAEGVGNADGQLDAKKISFTPDEFAIQVAEEQQIMASQAATQRAQSTANAGVAAAGDAQSSANQAQSSAKAAQSMADRAQDLANQADAQAQSAADLGIMNAAAVQLINKRVSDLDEYQTVAETAIYFGNDKAVLDGAARQDLDELAAVATSLDSYMIEIAGYASSPGTRKLNQKLSEARAGAVAAYLREAKNVPMRRILAPAGYGATHLFESNADPEDRPLDRRVDVKVLVNKAFGPPAQ